MKRLTIFDFRLRIGVRLLAALSRVYQRLRSRVQNRQSQIGHLQRHAEAGFAMAYVAIVLMFVGIPLSFAAADLVRLAWARSEMQKAADAAAEAGAQMADVIAWKNNGVVQLLPDAPGEAAYVANVNASGLNAKGIYPSITFIAIDEQSNTVRVGMRARVQTSILSALFPQLSIETEGTAQLRLGTLR